MEIDDLTPAEQRVWRAFATGTTVDFLDDAGGAPGPDGGPEPVVRAAVLRALLLNGPREPGEVAALKVTGARITGQLDLRYAVVASVVRLNHCRFDAAPRLAGAHLNYLNLRDCALPGLAAARSRIDGSLRLTRCRIDGPVQLGGAQISGALFVDRAEITGEDPAQPVLALNQLSVDDDLCARGLRTRGPIRLDGASVAGSIDLEDAELSNPGGFVLHAEALGVGADLLARRMRAEGRIDLRGSRIPGRVDLLHTSLSNPGGTALRLSSCVMGELWLREGPAIEGRLNLRRAEVGQLHLAPEKLPDQVRLLDLTYTFLTPHEPAESRLPMLERDDGAFDPHAYEQLTAAYRTTGDDRAARLVQLAKQRRHRGTLPWYGRLWGHLQDAAVGYGFRPLRAAGWLLSLLAVGSIVYAGHHPPPLKAGEAPPFSPVFYTLDLLLPVISFGQESAFAPTGWYQTLSYVLTVTGWILASTVVAGVTRTVSRQ
ncbi:membrane-associated oxidoreductase [Streptomyces sp. IBSBF 2953]|uniref:membrane-associated oxidoreductase n=1 Tax=Streptomyces TaxID=1883 RepID=UPI00211A41C5|nr:membrane-associated oxidoreductase [Streptomyces scabiei]MCQ9180144.1 membrane-associated oxidoreductase [Streptomyces hayashii]MDX3112447.1 membrane-associated oxidoreductase [Streptomyces scabiei]